MLCTNCKIRQASVFIESSGKDEKKALCDACADMLGKYLTSPESIRTDAKKSFDLFSLITAKADDTLSCPLCADTLGQIISQKRLGCPACLKKFSPELSPIITYIYGSAVHIGRSPKKYAEKEAREKQLLLKKAELKNALENENYEKCARLRDEIRALSSEGRSF